MVHFLQKKLEIKEMRLNTILGTNDIPVLAQKHIHKVLLFRMTISFLMGLSSTFYILFVIDKIGFALAATTTSIMLLTQLLLDYPSGTLGDWIGQRWVLAIAFTSYCFVFFFLMQDPSTFEQFAFVGMLNGFGNAQSSGAIETWVDNNYQKVIADSDPDRRIYGFAMSRIDSINDLSLGASFFIGGILATQNTRIFVFSIQFFLTLLVILLILLYLTDIKLEGLDNTKAKEKIKLKEYSILLIGGIKFVISSKRIFFFFLGLSIYNVTWLIWGNLILFPIYFGYTGTDALASTLRTVIFFTGIPISYYMANVSKKISNERFPFTVLLQMVLFFPIFIALTYFIPVSDDFNPLGIILTFLLLGPLAGFLFEISVTLSKRILLDLVPSENRNAIYSLLPSIVSLLGIPVLPLAGAAVEAYGLSVGISLMMIVCAVGYLFIKLGMKKPNVQKSTIENSLTTSSAIGD
jgi:MFS family permease